MTIPPDVEAFIVSVRTQTRDIRVDPRVLDPEVQWHKGYLHGVIEATAIALGHSVDEILRVLQST